MKDKEKLILTFLKKNGGSSTTKIASGIKADIWITKKYLESLEEEKKVICNKETKITYWRLKNKDE